MSAKTSRRPSKTKEADSVQSKPPILNPYESIFIVKPSLSEDQISSILEKVKEIIEGEGGEGEVVSSDNWGKKRLAYEVQKERRGIYIVVHFKAAGGTIHELERYYRFSEQIIKYMNLRIESEALGKSQPVVEEKAFAYRNRDSRRWK